MNIRHLSRAAAAFALTAALGMSAGCATYGGYYGSRHARVYVAVAPPPPVYEARVVAPGPGYVWVPGYYAWNGRGYVWSRGRWERPPHARAEWVPPRWQHDRRGYYVVEGHWR